MEKPWMSVVVPVFNEERAVADIVTALTDWLDEHGRPYEILVVDNASEDRTVELLEPLLDGARIRLLRNDANRGKGFSVRRGMLEAKGEVRLLCDADCAPSLASLDEMLSSLEDADLVVGSRLAEGASLERHQPLRRRLLGRPFLMLSRLVMAEPTRDLYCGFKLWREGAAEWVFPRQRVEGWAFDAESLALARRHGCRVREVGIEWTHRPESRLSMWLCLRYALPELLAARRSVRSQPRRRMAPASELVAESPKPTS